MPYTCNYCKQTHCSEHRMPENHYCGTTTLSVGTASSSNSGGDGDAVTRRGVLTTILAIATGAGGYAYISENGVPGPTFTVPNNTSVEAPVDDSPRRNRSAFDDLFGLLDSDEAEDHPWDNHLGGDVFSGYSWIDQQTMRVWVPADHPSVDEIQLYHEYDELRDGPQYFTTGIPDYDGTITIDFVDAFTEQQMFSNSQTRFPTPVFELKGVRTWSTDAGVIGSFQFELTEELQAQFVS